VVLREAVQVGYFTAEVKGGVALYIISLTFVCNANYTIKTITVLLSSKLFVV